MPYCEKHNREMLRSKYKDKRTGELGWWCPDCYDLYKAQKQQKVEVQTPEEYKEDEDKSHEETLLNLTKMTEEELIKRLDNIDSGLVGIRMDINNRLDEMAKYLKTKLM